MSEATEQAVHDAIAAHIADVNEDDPEYLTEWCIVASAAMTDARSTAYYYLDSALPHHHARGLLEWGKDHITESRLIAMLSDEDD